MFYGYSGSKKSERVVKSAARTRPNQTLNHKTPRRIKSARETPASDSTGQRMTGQDQAGATGDRAPAKKQKAQPEILKYHREKTVEAVPSVDTLNEDVAQRIKDAEPAPLTDGVFGGQCQFCGKPIMTPPLNDFDQEEDEVIFV